jgi:hypothetical protein
METQFVFAGFSWPRYIARGYFGIANIRRKIQSRKHAGEYYHAPAPRTRYNSGQVFYLDSDGQHFRRWNWCGDVHGGIKHNGWYTDDNCEGTLAGIVVYLPHGRILAGWSMGKGMSSFVDTSRIFDDAKEAARAADELAEYAAERERDYQREQDQSEPTVFV